MYSVQNFNVDLLFRARPGTTVSRIVQIMTPADEKLKRQRGMRIFSLVLICFVTSSFMSSIQCLSL